LGIVEENGQANLFSIVQSNTAIATGDNTTRESINGYEEAPRALDITILHQSTAFACPVGSGFCGLDLVSLKPVDAPS